MRTRRVPAGHVPLDVAAKALRIQEGWLDLFIDIGHLQGVKVGRTRYLAVGELWRRGFRQRRGAQS